MRVPLFFLSLFPLLLSTSSIALAEETAQHHINEGNVLLSSGRFNDALKSFGAAIQRDPRNYLSYFKRAATYLSLGRSSSALEDFSRTLELKPDFDQALLQRAKIYVKEGAYVEAKRDLKNYINKNPEDADSKKLLTSVKEAEDAIKEADSSIKFKKYDECVKSLSKAISVSPHFSSLRLKRAKCHFEKGEVEEGVRDLTQTSKLNPSDAELLMRLSKINYFALYQPEQSLTAIKQCIHYDPEHKECKRILRRIKQLEKSVSRVENDMEGHRWQLAIDKLFGSGSEKGPGLINEIKEEHDNLKEGRSSEKLFIKLDGLSCKAYQELKNGHKAIKWCSSTLNLDPENLDALINRAEAYILIEDYEAAIRDYTKAHEIDGRDERVKKGYQKTHRLLKSSKSKDYYKILGVPRSASKREIKKAFHKLAQKWHPDKYKGSLPREEVESKMSAINEAYEVLSNDELRERFDNGEDPNDNSGGSQPFHGNPFAHFGSGFSFGGGFPFGSSQSEGKNPFGEWHFAF
ncbi:580_t:CDS:2 [Ambispora leptoticha]|uniref:Tetratricopeptide repeat and J domain-containing co-chaperone DNJ1 n=1 Tax=Ambispora leptoticha TaxID=144679 RepID=A0A9N8V3D4_9GLOM|nr:580_t:CDS:2 [Ambispora leptoticha]